MRGEPDGDGRLEAGEVEGGGQGLRDTRVSRTLIPREVRWCSQRGLLEESREPSEMHARQRRGETGRRKRQRDGRGKPASGWPANAREKGSALLQVKHGYGRTRYNPRPWTVGVRPRARSIRRRDQVESQKLHRSDKRASGTRACRTRGSTCWKGEDARDGSSTSARTRQRTFREEEEEEARGKRTTAACSDGPETGHAPRRPSRPPRPPLNDPPPPLSPPPLLARALLSLPRELALPQAPPERLRLDAVVPLADRTLDGRGARGAHERVARVEGLAVRLEGWEGGAGVRVGVEVRVGGVRGEEVQLEGLVGEALPAEGGRRCCRK